MTTPIAVPFVPRPAATAPPSPVKSSFEIVLPGRPAARIGRGEPAFRVVARTPRAVSALKSFDELAIGEAYLDGDLDLEGDLLAALDLRSSFSDRHPLHHLWKTLVQPLVFGQVRGDKKWIAEHYDEDPEFYLLFLDKQSRCYSHGYFERDDEPLEDATVRKLDTALASVGARPGDRILDIGAGWGAFTRHAAKRGIEVTSLTISKESHAFVSELIAREGLRAKVVLDHFLEHRAREPYDAVVNLGVSEHLPDYDASLAQYQRLLKPGGRVFLDFCTMRKKFALTAFVRRHIWPGNASPVELADYVRAVGQTPFEIGAMENDRRSYMLTARHWATRLDRSKDEIVRRWGERLYRRFRLYLWGCVQGFQSGSLGAYHLTLTRITDSKARAKRPLFPWQSPLFADLVEAFR
jgi:cyclopropane-fatty-acyl-phospholipid synthase